MSEAIDTDLGSSGLEFAREWPVMFVVGLITLGLGIVVISWPQETLTVISVLIGLQVLIHGVYRLITVFAHDTISPGFTTFVGVVGIVAGVVVLRHPFQTVAVLAVVLGVVWIIGGSIELLSAIADSTLDRRGLLAVGGLLSIAAGVVVAAWPAPTATRRRLDLGAVPDRLRAVHLRHGVPAARSHHVAPDAATGRTLPGHADVTPTATRRPS